MIFLFFLFFLLFFSLSLFTEFSAPIFFLFALFFCILVSEGYKFCNLCTDALIQRITFF